jgi:hypothetical protein
VFTDNDIRRDKLPLDVFDLLHDLCYIHNRYPAHESYRKRAQSILRSPVDTTKPRRSASIIRTKIGKSDKAKARGYLIRECDDLCSTLVIARDKVCVSCGGSNKLASAHILPKGHYGRLRFDLYNLMALCFNCHLGNDGWHKNPLKWQAWFDAKYPGRKQELLVMEAAAKPPDLKELVICLRAEVRALNIEG